MRFEVGDIFYHINLKSGAVKKEFIDSNGLKWYRYESENKKAIVKYTVVGIVKSIIEGRTVSTPYSSPKEEGKINYYHVVGDDNSCDIYTTNDLDSYLENQTYYFYSLNALYTKYPGIDDED